MQAHNGDDQRSTQSDSDGGRNAERDTVRNAFAVAFASLAHLADRKVRVAEPGKPLNLSASLHGQGGIVT